MMLLFNLFKSALTAEPEQIWIEPAAVASVQQQSARKGYGGWYDIAIITMIHGGQHIVEDPGRTAAISIAAAKEQEPTQ